MKTLIVAALAALTIPQTLVGVIIEYGRGNQMLIGKVEQADNELQKGDLNAALRDSSAAIATDLKFFPAYFIRAQVYLAQGKYQLAVNDCNAGLKLEPQFVDLAIFRAEANRGLRNYAASLRELDHVITIRPPRTSMMAMAFDARAWLRATCPDAAFRDGRKAIADAKRAVSLTSSQNAAYLDTLAAAHAEAGDFDSAIKTEQQAINVGDSATHRAHLASFQQHKPIRDG